MYETFDMPVQATQIAIMEAYQKPALLSRMEGLFKAIKVHLQDRDPFLKVMVEEHVELLNYERNEELLMRKENAANDLSSSTRYGKGKAAPEPPLVVVDHSVSDLLKLYISGRESRKALKVKQSFKVPDKRYWHVEVKTLAEMGEFQELSQRVANKKVPPIGYDTFIEACIEHKNYTEAARYIALLPDAHEQMEWLCQIGFWQQAADIAFKEKDTDALGLIRMRCRTPAVMTAIDQMLKSMA
jgi:hypothetical protein